MTNEKPEKIEKVELKNKHIDELMIDHCKIDRIRINNIYVNFSDIVHIYAKYMRFEYNYIETLYTGRNVTNGKPDKLEIF